MAEGGGRKNQSSIRHPSSVILFFEFMMILHGHENDAGEKDQIRPAERAKGEVFRDESDGGHHKNAGPDTEEPDQADVIRGLSFHDPHNERDIKKRKKDAGPRAELH